MKRREFITLLGGAAAAWPLSAHAQQAQRMRHLGVLTPLPADHPDAKARHLAFLQAFEQLGWTDGKNVQIEARWSAGEAAITRKQAAELVALKPDVVLATGNAGTEAILQATRSIPVVFVIAADPVGSGYVYSLAEPGGNATGFTQFEYDLSAKWLELLKEIAPNVTRAAVLRDAGIAGGIGQFAVIQSVARSVGVDVRAINLRDGATLESSVAAFARSPNSGLILTTSALSAVHRDLIISLAAAVACSPLGSRISIVLAQTSALIGAETASLLQYGMLADVRSGSFATFARHWHVRFAPRATEKRTFRNRRSVPQQTSRLVDHLVSDGKHS